MGAMALQDELDHLLDRLRRAGTELHDVEVKEAGGGYPKSLLESVSAFANTAGGTIVLGLAEHDGFTPVEIDAPQLASDLAAACADQLEPAIRPEIDVAQVDGAPVVVAVIDELPSERKPCYVKTKGMERGSYLRTHDGDRLLTTYEIHVLVSSRGQPRDDVEPVPGTSVDDLDDDLTTALLRRLRTTRGPVFSDADDNEVLRLVGVLVASEDGSPLTLAGLVALGRYPQHHLPQLDITFVALPTTSGEPLRDGTRFLDNQSIDGPIPTMVTAAIGAVRRNMTRRSTILGAGRRDDWEYPEEVLREVTANALMHRDYHPLARGAQVRVELYPDRIEVKSPGGLHGPVPPENLLSEPVTSSRNATLAKLLEDIEIPRTGRTVAENRGSGLVAAATALRNAGLEPPEIVSRPSEFKIAIRNHGLLDEETLAWLADLDTSGLSDRQHLALAYLRRNDGITNQQYRTLTGCNSLDATRDLTRLATAGLLEKRNDRRWTVWALAESLRPTQARLDFEHTEVEAATSPRADRRDEIRALLQSGPRSTRDLAEAIGIGPEAVRLWLKRMEADEEVRPTETTRRSPHNRWELR